ncbi:PREDICTED: DNA primase large subunit [Rhagoletis zephyria]|uniref:DNA primase large subunit n=1 Tax=Rhagoletis zephyria TaxID=28612 RepID=UPI000811819F|nr:PREDICTED: DNA primase large subunit [Rhagoletis zephyria]
MDFRRKTRPRLDRKPQFENLEAQYPHNVALYRFPPTEDIKIHDFEDLALERLKVLRILEQATSKNLRFLSDEWKESVNAELNREGLKGYLRLCTNSSANSTANSTKYELELQARRRDYISHFILRLAYCRTEELKRWFLTREMELFKYKFSSMSSTDIKHFLDLNKLEYTPLSESQKDAVKDGLYESTIGQSVSKIELLDFYKVPFTQVLDLVRTRRCYLKDGFAYVNTQDFVSIIAVLQLNEIEHGLQSAQKLIREVETDERIFHLLKSLHTSYTGKDYALSKEGNVPPESLDQLSKKSFPICMRSCHEHLRTHHHLKHGGRMQYGLFLKGIGVTLEDSLRFFREEFTKKIDAEQFAKRYEYNIYHNYGKKGSMISYMPYSCLKIIQENPVQDDCRGCPYKSSDPSLLKMKLTSYGLSSAHVQEIMTYATKGHYQLACGKYFQIMHESPGDMAINHPNQYFEESQILMGNRTSKKAANASIRKPMKRGANDTTQVMNADEDDELWNIAETQESTFHSQQAERSAWDEDLDLTAIDC